MNAMQLFYRWLTAKAITPDAYRAGLTRLARASRAQLASLNLDWVPW